MDVVDGRNALLRVAQERTASMSGLTLPPRQVEDLVVVGIRSHSQCLYSITATGKLLTYEKGVT